MPARVPPSNDLIHDLEVLVRAHHPLILVESVEEERVSALLMHVADRLGMPLLDWSPTTSLRRLEAGSGPIATTSDPVGCLAFIEGANAAMLFHLRGMHRSLESPEAIAHLKRIYQNYFKHSGAVVISGPSLRLPEEVEPLFTPLELRPPDLRGYYDFVAAVIRDVKQRRQVTVDLTSEDVSELLNHMRGLTFFEVQKIITQAIIEDGKLSREDLTKVLDAKKRIIQRSGVLEYFPQEKRMADIAGLENLKAWLRKRQVAFAEPERAREFGLSPPRGLLLLGVQGCGKSLCAKAVSSEWRLPLVRLDPSSLYQKYYGESEKNFTRATRTAEAMAPIVLWIDEIEKAFGQDDRDGGTTGRIFATFLAWLQEKSASVFVVATANDITKLPPELLRKGRFDEIFFVDLPSPEVRREIFAVHLRHRDRNPSEFDLDALAVSTEGFSGAEIEQAVISGLYSAFSGPGDLTTDVLLREVNATRPLSVTMSERVEALRAWARNRAVPADPVEPDA